MSQDQPDSTVPILGEGFQDSAPTTASNVTPSGEETPDPETKGGNAGSGAWERGRRMKRQGRRENQRKQVLHRRDFQDPHLK